MERTGGWRDAGGRKEGWLPVDWREKEKPGGMEGGMEEAC